MRVVVLQPQNELFQFIYFLNIGSNTQINFPQTCNINKMLVQGAKNNSQSQFWTLMEVESLLVQIQSIKISEDSAFNLCPFLIDKIIQRLDGLNDFAIPCLKLQPFQKSQLNFGVVLIPKIQSTWTFLNENTFFFPFDSHFLQIDIIIFIHFHRYEKRAKERLIVIKGRRYICREQIVMSEQSHCQEYNFFELKWMLFLRQFFFMVLAHYCWVSLSQVFQNISQSQFSDFMVIEIFVIMQKILGFVRILLSLPKLLILFLFHYPLAPAYHLFVLVIFKWLHD